MFEEYKWIKKLWKSQSYYAQLPPGDNHWYCLVQILYLCIYIHSYFFF